MAYFIGGILGLALGIGIALFVTCTLVKRSNDIGDSSGNLSDFGYLNKIISEDGLHNANSYGRGSIILQEKLKRMQEERNINQ